MVAALLHPLRRLAPPLVLRRGVPRVLSTAAEFKSAGVPSGEPPHPDPVLGKFTEDFLGELQGASKASSPAELADALVAAAQQAGSTDDITVVCAKLN